jgi:UDP-N-acetylmuramate--alanine ligase
MKHAHFVGIAGAGLSAIAAVLAESGWTVSGCDVQPAAAGADLGRRGIPVFEGHDANHVAGADVLVVSSAIPADSPEVLAAIQRGIPVQKRAAFLSEFLAGSSVIAVAGTHGKTTTSGLIAFLLDRAGRDPSFVVGGHLADFDSNARRGAGPLFVIEADEYDGMFLGLRPVAAVVTNVEHDHPDCYPTPEAMQEAFQEFVKRIVPRGYLLACGDDPGAAGLAAFARQQGLNTALYGSRNGAEWKADLAQPNWAGGSDFLVMRGTETLGLARNRLPGLHNVANSLAALAMVMNFGVDFNTARNALADFRGVGRRFEVKGEAGGVTVIDDYAHHPTEIRATLAAARRRYPGQSIWAMFQPHTYSRTRALLADFAASFRDADHVVVTDIYRSREQEDPAVNAGHIVQRMQHPDARHIPGLADTADYLVEKLQPGDVLITLGAGDGNAVGEMVLKRLNGQKPELNHEH